MTPPGEPETIPPPRITASAMVPTPTQKLPPVVETGRAPVDGGRWVWVRDGHPQPTRRRPRTTAGAGITVMVLAVLIIVAGAGILFMTVREIRGANDPGVQACEAMVEAFH